MLDALTLPFRFLAVVVLAFLFPEFLFEIFEEASVVVRRLNESSVNAIGIPPEGKITDEFLERLDQELSQRYVKLKRQERHTLVCFTLLAGFEGRNELWVEEGLRAIHREGLRAIHRHS